MCDEIADPHNLSAILRTAECAGRTRRCYPEARHSVGLTAAVGKASAGAVGYTPPDMDGTDWCQTDFSGPAALVVGSEGFGVSNL